MIVDSVLSSSLTIKNNLPIVDEIKKDLTVDYIDYDKERIIKKFYKLVDDIVLLPRYYKSDKVKFNYVKEKLTHGDDISIDIKKDFQIRDDKIEVLNQISKHKNGIIKLPTGFGKTVLSVLRIAQLKKKAMIVVDREILLDQWKQSILNITNLSEDDIGIYQGNKSELAKPVVIVMVQTLISKLKQDPYRAISEFYNANFGVTFVDEIHSIIGPDVYSDARLVFFSEYLYGLSATPFRNIDKETDIIKYCFGDIIVERTNDVRPKVIFNLFKNTLPKKTYYYLT
ncbi:MAG: DEAD/DEAH box helicase family protein, partial [Candidatus Micrarchaeaceae archaeon]